MTANERIVKLQQAAKLIEEVRDSLSTESNLCECCGLKKYNNFDQHQVREALNASLTRLDKTVARMQEAKHSFVQ